MLVSKQVELSRVLVRKEGQNLIVVVSLKLSLLLMLSLEHLCLFLVMLETHRFVSSLVLRLHGLDSVELFLLLLMELSSQVVLLP